MSVARACITNEMNTVRACTTNGMVVSTDFKVILFLFSYFSAPRYFKVATKTALQNKKGTFYMNFTIQDADDFSSRLCR